MLTIAAATAPAEALSGRARHFRTAFASYASQERDTVMRIIQGLQKGAPGLEVYVDVASLRAGQNWEHELNQVIPTRDVFYLFWSRAASQSNWVEA